MKKKIFGGIAAVAIAAIVALNVNFGAKNNNLSEVFLANIEALASENGSDCGHGCCYPCSGTYCCTFLGKSLSKP